MDVSGEALTFIQRNLVIDKRGSGNPRSSVVSWSKVFRSKGIRVEKERDTNLPIIGWREWVALPDLGVSRIKAKVDSGARSSSLHASNIEPFVKDNKDWVRFDIRPRQRSNTPVVHAESEVHEYRFVRSSSGVETERPVIVTQIKMMGQIWQIELTLADRNEMGFRMLLGREAFRGKFLLDAGNSFFGGKPIRKKKKK